MNPDHRHMAIESTSINWRALETPPPRTEMSAAKHFATESGPKKLLLKVISGFQGKKKGRKVWIILNKIRLNRFFTYTKCQCCHFKKC